MKKTFIYKLMAIVSIPVIAVSMFGCADPEYPTPVPATAAPTGAANLLVINASPDAPALSIYVNNVAAGPSLPAAGMFTTYVKTPIGQAAVRASATSGKIGGTLDAASILYRASTTNQNNFSFNNNANYTFIITDSIARVKPVVLNGSNPGGPQFLTMSDNLTPPAAGKVKVRFLHLAPGAPNVYLTKASGISIATYSNVAYRNGTSNTTFGAAAAVAAFASIDAGASNIEVRTGSATGPVIASIDTFGFTAGKIYTIYLTGKRANNIVKVPYAVAVATHN